MQALEHLRAEVRKQPRQPLLHRSPAWVRQASPSEVHRLLERAIVLFGYVVGPKGLDDGSDSRGAFRHPGRRRPPTGWRWQRNTGRDLELQKRRRGLVRRHPENPIEFLPSV